MFTTDRGGWTWRAKKKGLHPSTAAAEALKEDSVCNLTSQSRTYPGDRSEFRSKKERTRRPRKPVRKHPPSRIRPRASNTLPFLLMLVLFAFSSLYLPLATADQSRTSPSVSPPLSKSTKTKRATNKNTHNTDHNETSLSSSPILEASDVIQITETELWDGKKWKSGESRWTDTQSQKPCASPDKHQPPANRHYDGDWKIVTGGTGRDVYGWEYTVAYPYPMRQRVWLRNLAPAKEVIKIRRKVSLATPALKRRPRKWPRWMRAIRDDFNFKGFGLSLYKSLVFPTSFGISFRLPLTYNFGRWETNPGLPSVSTAIGLYFPGMAMISISTSVRIEWLKYILGRMVEISCYLVLVVVWTLLQGLVLASSAVLFPVTRILLQPPFPMTSPWARPVVPTYSRKVQERLGCSVSWRFSLSSGYEFRVSYWHYYAYSLTAMWPTVQRILELVKNEPEMPEWWARHTAAFGVSTSSPLPYAPYVTSSLCMSLDALQLYPAQKVHLVSTTTTTSVRYTRNSREMNDGTTLVNSIRNQSIASFANSTTSTATSGGTNTETDATSSEEKLPKIKNA